MANNNIIQFSHDKIHCRKNNKTCENRETCPFAHFTKCEDSNSCTNIKCTYSHPNSCKKFLNCTIPSCNLWHRPQICEKAPFCLESLEGKCLLFHPPICKYGQENCKNREICKYSHPPPCPKQSSSCQFSELCPFWHDPSLEVRIFSTPKTSCRYGDECRYKHRCKYRHPGANLVQIEDIAPFQTLLTNTCISSYIGKGADAPGLTHRGFTVTRVYYIVNPTLKKQYEETVKSIGKEKLQLDPLITGCATRKHLPKDFIEELESYETFLFHGTKHNLIQNQIIDGGLNVEASNPNKLFGKAIYFTEHSSKADVYTDPNAKGRHSMLLSKVCLGQPHRMTAGNPNLTSPPCQQFCGIPTCLHPRYNSVIGLIQADNPSSYLKKYREFMVYKNQQCMALYLIHYQRV